MMKMIVLISCTLLSACVSPVAVSQPAVVISDEGQVLRGFAQATWDGQGSFSVSGSGLTCSGVYDAMTTSTTLSFSVICNNGLKGIATSTRDASLQTGSGVVRMFDGSEWNFVFGPIANTL